MTLIDLHVHVSRREHERPWVLEFIESQSDGDVWAKVGRILTPTTFRPFLQENGIDWAVALAEDSPATVGVTPHDYVADLCAKANAQPDPATGARGKIIPFASLNPFTVNDLALELEKLVKDFGFRGFKAYPVYQHHYMNDIRMYPLYAKAQELGVPMLVHTGSSVFKGARIKYGDPLHLDDVAIDFPNLTIMMAHSGRPFWYEQAFWLARQHKNVYMELSGLPGKKLLEYFPELERNADKIVYGSDWPGNPYIRRNVDAILSLPLKDSTKEKILWKNAEKVLGVEVRRA
ncbi:MAG: amidohydrolase [Chloroflexi bacterium]|nr:amidohydrolase [Chloroflexota bacterium]